MTNSGNSRGNIDGSDNLSPANFSKFAGNCLFIIHFILDLNKNYVFRVFGNGRSKV